MFSLFKRNMPAQLRNVVGNRGRGATGHLASQIQGSNYVLDVGTINFARSKTRKELLHVFREYWADISKNRERRPQQLQYLFGEAYDEATVYQAGATHMIAGLLKTDVVCRGAEEYPKDKTLIAFALNVLMMNLQAFDFILTGTHAHKLGEPTPSIEILAELQYADAPFEESVSFR